MQTYVQNATPAPGYAFDMTFLMTYTAINADNYDTYTQAKLAEAYRTDLEGVTFSESNSPLQRYKTEANGEYMRIADNSLKESYNVFAVYQLSLIHI